MAQSRTFRLAYTNIEIRFLGDGSVFNIEEIGKDSFERPLMHRARDIMRELGICNDDTLLHVGLIPFILTEMGLLLPQDVDSCQLEVQILMTEMMRDFFRSGDDALIKYAPVWHGDSSVLRSKYERGKIWVDPQLPSHALILTNTVQANVEKIMNCILFVIKLNLIAQEVRKWQMYKPSRLTIEREDSELEKLVDSILE